MIVCVYCIVVLEYQKPVNELTDVPSFREYLLVRRSVKVVKKNYYVLYKKCRMD